MPLQPNRESAPHAANDAARVNELDLLRFLAAMSVVFFHYSSRGYAAGAVSTMSYTLLTPVTKYGYLGVQLFFLISGFVILMTAAGGSLRSFAVSRAVRLYPAFWVCCTVTFATIALLGAERFSATTSHYLINMTLLSGFFGVPSIDGVYWSLFVELKFYLLVALVLAAGMIHRAELLLVLWLVSTIALTAMPIGILHSLLVTNYAAYFIAGSMCFLVWSQGFSLLRGGVILAAWLVALTQSAKEVGDFESHFHTGLDARVVVVLITIFFAVMLLVATRRTGPLGKRRWLALGAITYPLYLLHQYIGYMIFNAAYPAIDRHVLLWGTIALMLVAAYGVNVLLERRLAALLKNMLNSALDIGLHRVSRRSSQI